MWGRDFRPSTIGVKSIGESEKLVRGISSSSIRANTEITKEVASQSIYPDTVIASAVKPVASFTTYDIRGAIDALGLLGKCITSDVDDYGMKLWGQAQSCAGIQAGSVHDLYTIANGLVVPTTLTVDHRGNCQLTYDIYMRSADGANAPVVYQPSQALPAGGAGVVGRFTMGAMAISGNPWTGKRNVTINFNPTITQEGADSDIYDGVVSIESIMPQVQVRGVDTSWLGTIGIAGDVAVHGDTSFLLRRRDVALNTANHINLTFAGLISWDTLFDGNANSPATATIQIDCKWDGTNTPIKHTLDYNPAP